MKYKDKVVVQSYISAVVCERLKQLAEEQDISVSRYIAHILRDHVNSQDSAVVSDAIQGTV